MRLFGDIRIIAPFFFASRLRYLGIGVKLSQRMEAKKAPWQSKSLWVGLFAAIAPFFPAVEEWIQGNELAYSQALGLVFLLLRLITKDKISIR